MRDEFKGSQWRDSFDFEVAYTLNEIIKKIKELEQIIKELKNV